MEQAQCVGLDDLGKAKDTAEFVRGGRDSHREQCVAGLGRSYQVAHRADTADARHERGHFGEWAPLAELFESAELRDVELRVVYLPLFVEVQGDFGVALNAGHRVNNDGSAFCHDVLLISCGAVALARVVPSLKGLGLRRALSPD